MRIRVKAKPNAKKEKLDQVGEAEFVVAVKAPPREGKANEAIIKVLAEHLDVAPWRIQLVSGFASRQKVFEILS